MSSKEPETGDGNVADGSLAASSTDDDYKRSKRSKFRFKSKRKSRDDRDASPRSHTHEGMDGHTSSRRRQRHRRQHHHHRSSKRQKATDTHTPSADDRYGAPLSPNTAFRESLFDALGDDEGAAFWESVYGQPIHNYSSMRPTGPTGELEQMTEDEYATYVRAKMWERTHQGIMEERERRKAQREKDKQREKEGEREREQFNRAMDESLRRGMDRKKKKAWTSIWDTYLTSWENLGRDMASAATDDVENGSDTHAQATPGREKRLRNLIMWPVESGKRKDVNRNGIEEFVRHAPPPAGSDSPDLSATLKAERIRWHPDKIQQRFGSSGIEEDVMRSVTEVFQILDHLWNEEREKTK